MDAVDLASEFELNVATLQVCPAGMRGRYAHAMRVVLEEISISVQQEDAVGEARAWKAFGLLSRMLLHKPVGGKIEAGELRARFDAFARGDWSDLLAAARQSTTRERQSQSGTSTSSAGDLAQRACDKVRLEECTRARQILTASPLAPGNAETLNELSDPQKRPPRALAPIPPEVLQFESASAVAIPFKLFVSCLRSAPRGSSGGPGSTTYEHLKVALDDEDTAALLHKACERLARAHAPVDTTRAFMQANLTALVKKNGKVRGIATGTSLRRLVARCLAKQYGPAIEEACAPFQYALSTRAGTDCVGHLLRAATDLGSNSTILSIDGVGAYDHIRRATMLGKLMSLPRAAPLLPWVRLSYAQPSTYLWRDDSGVVHHIPQGEGGEQGDPLMPMLFALGIHDPLAQVAANLQPDEHICAFLDDIYTVCAPEIIRPIFDLLQRHLYEIAGIEIALGKTRVWNQGGAAPPNIQDLEEQAARTGDQVWNPDGIVVLGTPIGSDTFVQAQVSERLDNEATFLDQLPGLPDVQCAWQLLVRCAVPRMNHVLRTLPPGQAARYASRHDELIWSAAVRILGAASINPVLRNDGWDLASLPARLGGLGLRSASRTRPAAYWASWADALHMMSQRSPALLQRILAALDNPPAASSLAELSHARATLVAEGFRLAPSWEDLSRGARPPQPTTTEPGEWTHGWQYHAATCRERFFRRHSVLACASPANRALLRSQSGPLAGTALNCAPTGKEFELSPERFRALTFRRLRWPLPLLPSACEGCGSHMDVYGDHRCACMVTGRVKLRSIPMERVLARICTEAGARVRTNIFLRHLNLPVLAGDDRRIEVLAQGLPCYGGAQLAIDATMGSPLRGDGQPRPRAAWQDGAALLDARRDKDRTYPEFQSGTRARLVVIAAETGGRVSAETVDFLWQLATARASSAPWYLRGSAAYAHFRRWSRLLAVTCANALAASLLEERDALALETPQAGGCPWLMDLLAEARLDMLTPPSGLPLRG